MTLLSQITQTHLAVIMLDKNTTNPISRMPVYAEIGVIETKPPFVLGEELQLHLEPPIARLVRLRLPQFVSEEVYNTMGNELKAKLLNHITELLTISDNPFLHPESEWQQLVDEAIIKTLTELDMPASPQALKQTVYSYPLGFLATDHVGYVSFDLSRFAENSFFDRTSILKREFAFFVYPMGKEGIRLAVLDQARLTKEAIFAKFDIDPPMFETDIQSLNLPSMQKPSLVDWYLSPGSFAAKPDFLVGEDGCEQLMPAQLALYQFNFRQVVRVGQAPGAYNIPPEYKFGYVDEYRASWYSLGHSLGEILYSLPLAPGESVKLAVIDWSWDNLSKRDETTKLTENVLHQTHRDRTITETVNAALNEWQRGGNIMGGNSGGAGVSASYGWIGLAAGNAHSFGGAYSTSSGSRDLAANNVQSVIDGFAQASSAQREINSTVVIQARQEEKESIQTRTFTNYNHSHTLTILYYEVLRHYKVEVEWVRRRPAVLVKMPLKLPGTLTANLLLGRRYLLEPFLLDPKLSAVFDAVARFALGEEKLKRETNKWAANTQTIDPGAKSFVRLISQFTTTGDDTSEPVFVVLYLHDGRAFEFQCDGAGDEGTSREFEHSLPFPINWNQIKGIEVKLKNINSGGDWEETNILITMVTGANERVSILADGATRTLDDDRGSTGLLLSIQPPPATTTTVGLKPQRNDFVSAEDDLAVQSLIGHIEANRAYYSRVLMLATDPNTIAIEFEGKAWNAGQVMADYVGPTPLEVFGSYVAYPLLEEGNVTDQFIQELFNAVHSPDPEQQRQAITMLANLSEKDMELVATRFVMKKAKAEKLITLPTRGVFAEGKLGHCNISEEIDNTRFWKWEEHPIPFEAPGINPVTPVTPQPQQVNVAPTPFPQSLVNIVNPSPAPDPTGLSEALKLLATPNIFRDMSGRAEVADLLKKLSDNSVSFAEAANKAREIQGKYGADLAGIERDKEANAQKFAADIIKAGMQVNSSEPQSGSPTTEKATIDNDKAKLEGAKEYLSPKEQKEVRSGVTKKWTTPSTPPNTIEKIFVFKGKDFQGMDLEFSINVAMVDHKDRETNGAPKTVLKSAFTRMGSIVVKFKESDPLIDVQVDVEPFNFEIASYKLIIPKIRLTTTESVLLKGAQKTVEVRLQQGSRQISVEEETIEQAAQEFATKYGGELGVDKAVALKLLGEKAEKTTTQRDNKTLVKYTITVPDKAFSLAVK